MQRERTTSLATAIVFATGVLWGFYWLPVRALSGLGLPGAWGTLAITFAAALLLSPAAIFRRHAIARAGLPAFASVALGGAAFALYSIGLVYGRVAIVILLYFLTPVWSTLIGRYVMGWPTPPMRIAAIAVGLVGLVVMLGADGGVPMPKSTGEWMGLLAGILWSVATTGMRTKSGLQPREAAFVFAVGAAATALLLAPVLETWPQPDGIRTLLSLLAVTLAGGGLWWGLSIAALMWATVRLEPARVGILLMAEVLVGATSAAVLAGEALQRLEIIGGALVLVAGILEIWPVRGLRQETESQRR
ncbi:DMT family transporter [Afifella aestuarii]|uniref:DMT family transporter n=1 Tax=Afifella aestuarii TaxID=1909496 RepID=UPI000FE421B9|nr:DMT family transporter [Afifella aestuarii]